MTRQAIPYRAIPLKIVIAGGTGFIGQALCRSLIKMGHSITVLSRAPRKASKIHIPSLNIVHWDGKTSGVWKQALEGAEAVINLAGEPIADARWTQQRKQVLRESRIGTTMTLVQAMSKLSNPPRTLINASGVGLYGPRGNSSVSENTEPGKGFLAELCMAWEREALKATDLGIRVVIFRIGMVLGLHGGALPRMILPFKLFAGGPILPGDQWVSWIHVNDLIELITWALTHEEIKGSVNAVSPNPVSMKEFCNSIGKTLNRPSWLPVPGMLLKLGLGELSTLMTTGQRVEPSIALQGGFAYHYPTLPPALEEILRVSLMDQPVEK